MLPYIANAQDILRKYCPHPELNAEGKEERIFTVENDEIVFH